MLCGAMSWVQMRPRSQALRPFIECFSYGESHLPPALERILPAGRTDLMVNLYEDEFRTYHGADYAEVRTTRGAMLGGPRSHATVIDTREMRHHLTVNFRLGGAWPFFRVPLAEAREQLVGLEHLWGRDGATLRERVLAAPAPEAKFEILESVLLAQLARAHGSNPPESLDALILFSIRAFHHGAPVARVAGHLGQLHKSFARRFRAQIGLSPKRFSRVLRLQRVLRAMTTSADPDLDWADLAASHGFTDQSHLIHEFRELTSLTPSTCRPRSAAEHNHVPIPAAPAK
jgi:AraC-like DNA-binding protein